MMSALEVRKRRVFAHRVPAQVAAARDASTGRPAPGPRAPARLPRAWKRPGRVGQAFQVLLRFSACDVVTRP